MSNLAGSVDSVDELAVKVSWFYYQEDMTQKEIADRLGLSRFKVGRLLKRAREEGIVRIEVQVPAPVPFQLRRDVERAFSLSEAVTTPTPSQQNGLKPALSKALAGYISRVLSDGDSLGLSYASTIFPLPEYLEPQKLNNATVMPIMGGQVGAGAQPRYDFISQVAETLGARFVPLYAPGVVDSPETKAALLSSSTVRSAFDEAAKCDLCVVGLGQVSQSNSLIKSNLMTKDEMQEVEDDGGVGELLAKFFDQDGQRVPTSITERAVCISAEGLEQIGRVVGVAGGHEKVDAIRAVLRTGLIDVLITDDETAKEMLEREGVTSPSHQDPEGVLQA